MSNTFNFFVSFDNVKQQKKRKTDRLGALVVYLWMESDRDK